MRGKLASQPTGPPGPFAYGANGNGVYGTAVQTGITETVTETDTDTDEWKRKAGSHA